jgi:hypothetical protein
MPPNRFAFEIANCSGIGRMCLVEAQYSTVDDADPVTAPSNQPIHLIIAIRPVTSVPVPL